MGCRPQEPKRPYPYREEEVTVENSAAGITLAGTLTEPDSGGPFPAVVLITGSVPENRDEEVFGHKPFLVLADYPTRQGIAVLRCDDRGVGKSGGDSQNATTADLATDALAEFEYLKTRKDIDPKRIGLLGHSEGGTIALIVANEAPDVAFVVLMAGPGLPGDSVSMLQSRLVAKAEGAADSTLASNAVAQRVLLDLAKSNLDSAALVAKLKPLLKQAMTEMIRADTGTMDKAVDQQVKQVLTPWFHYFLNYDPGPALAKLRQPVLATNGSKDVQVAPEKNLAVIEAALEAGGNKDYLVKELPGLNRPFQTANTGGVCEYARIEETISPSALKVIGDWILAHVRNQGQSLQPDRCSRLRGRPAAGLTWPRQSAIVVRVPSRARAAAFRPRTGRFRLSDREIELGRHRGLPRGRLSGTDPGRAAPAQTRQLLGLNRFRRQPGKRLLAYPPRRHRHEALIALDPGGNQRRRQFGPDRSRQGDRSLY